MNNTIVRQKAAAAENGFINRLVAAQQRKLLDAFREFSRSGGSVLEAGLVPVSEEPLSSGLFSIQGLPDRAGITVHRIRLAQASASPAVKGQSLGLPFDDGQFDWACSSGLIEHLPSTDQQAGFVREMARVARKGVFIATPNRCHPLNFSSTSRSRLLRAQDLYGFAASLPGKSQHDVGHKRVFGIKAHFFLMVTKDTNA